MAHLCLCALPVEVTLDLCDTAGIVLSSGYMLLLFSVPRLCFVWLWLCGCSERM